VTTIFFNLTGERYAIVIITGVYMSRTYKHTTEANLKRYYKSRWDDEYEKYEYLGRVYAYPDFSAEEFRVRTCYLKKAGVLTKKKKNVDSEHHWMTTPSWWNRMKHTRPERRRVNIALSQVSDVEEVDIPDLKRKPHIYFW
jgi:hypothetical protein